MTVSDILDGAFKLLKANARVVVPIVAVFVVPLQVLAAYAQRSLLGGEGLVDVLSDPSVADATLAQSDAEAIVGALAGLLNLLVLPFLAGAISQVVAASYLGQQLGVGAALRATWRRVWALSAGWVLVHLLEVAGFIVTAVLVVGLAVGGAPGIVVAAVAVLGLLSGFPVLLVVMALSVAVAPAIVVEGLGPVAGIRRSWGLLRRRFWPVLGIAVLAGLIATVIGQVLGAVPTVAGLLVGTSGGWLLIAVGAVLTALVTQPIVAIVATLQYFDARIRFEGFDLEVIAAELRASGPRR
jgi:hypothetical protein